MNPIIKGPEHTINIYGDVKFGKNVTLGSFIEIQDKVEIGDFTRIGSFTFIAGHCKIGENVFVGQHVSFTNDKNPIANNEDWVCNPVIVEDNVSIGSSCVLLPGITLGKGCKIGAGSVVTKSVPPGETWAGNPARKLIKRDVSLEDLNENHPLGVLHKHY